MPDGDKTEIGVEDAKESGEELMRNLKRFGAELVLSFRNTINRQHWLVRGGAKTLIGGLFVEVLGNSVSYLMDVNVGLNRIIGGYYAFIASAFPGLHVNHGRLLVAFIGLFVLVESLQLRHLSRIERIVGNEMEPRPDGGREVKTESQGSASGVGGGIGGAIAGAALGSAFGPQGTLFGAIAGAAFGSELEKSQSPKDPAEIRCALLTTLVRRHAWSQPISKEVVVRKAVAPESRRRASEVWEGLVYEPFILATPRGYKLDRNSVDQLVDYLEENCDWDDRRLQSELPNFDP